jgi:Ca2+-binding EF-hand superfamily protein
MFFFISGLNFLQNSSISLVEFHDCFFLFARDKGVTSTEELTIIMRSLGFSPTSTEIEGYFTEFKKGMKHVKQHSSMSHVQETSRTQLMYCACILFSANKVYFILNT